MPLFLVASPIGNLSDLSRQAIDTLKQAHTIAAEDTRRTSNLLRHLGIKARLVSYYDAVEDKRIPVLLELLKTGRDVVLISDAGTPCISDPGFRLVRAAIRAGVTVTPIPGPSAVTAALAASGLPPDRFRFEGYVPRTDGKRRGLLEQIRGESATTVLFEVSNRLLDTLDLLAALVPNRQVVVATELTKIHEEFVRGTAQQVAQRLRKGSKILGEHVLLVEGTSSTQSPEHQEIRRFVKVLQAQNLSPKTVRSLVAELLGVPKKTVFSVAQGDDDESG